MTCESSAPEASGMGQVSMKGFPESASGSVTIPSRVSFRNAAQRRLVRLRGWRRLTYPHSHLATFPARSHACEPSNALPCSTSTGLSHPLKRALDLVGATVGLILLTPLFGVVALAIWLTDGRPIFYVQERVGRGGRIFQMWKFRSMRRDAETRTGPIWAAANDDRCTRVGAWLRKTNIDELPQLWNVLKGEMSLVGPRPERPVFVEQFARDLPLYHRRHEGPGGMTGWAQVHGYRGRTSISKRLEYDLEYLDHWSLGLDLKILAMTVLHVLWGRSRWAPPPWRHTPPAPESRLAALEQARRLENPSSEDIPTHLPGSATERCLTQDEAASVTADASTWNHVTLIPHDKPGRSGSRPLPSDHAPSGGEFLRLVSLPTPTASLDRVVGRLG
ncbi:sugar transferase [Isosphaera pallida]|nr:sugar transferase [Isosphaera pallida]